MDFHPVGNGQLADFGLGHFPRVGAQRDVDFVRTFSADIVIEELEQALGVEGTAGPGDRHDEFHRWRIHGSGGLNKEQADEFSRRLTIIPY